MRSYLPTSIILAASIIVSSLFMSQNVFAEEPVEPEIVIRQEEDKTYYEYRVNGILKEIKVVPEIGPTYYLVPSDGNGWIREERSQLLVPKWILFEW